MMISVCPLLLGCVPAAGQVVIYDGRSSEGWYTTVDNDAPGAEQRVELAAEPGADWLKWTVATNADGQFTGYQVQRDIELDLSKDERLKWRWKSSGRYLQLQLWSGTKLAYWEDGALVPEGWRTESVALSQFDCLGGFEEANWAYITRVGLRIADSFAGYAEGATYEMGLRSVHGYEPLGRPQVQPPPAGQVDLQDTDDALAVGS